MNHSRLRAAFVLAAAALLVMSALAPRLRADAQSEPSSAWVVYPGCVLPLLQTTGLDEYVIPTHGRVTQPVTFSGNVAACSLTTVPVFSTALFSLVQWNAQSVMPDPTTVALRSVSLDGSELSYSRHQMLLSPPVVTRAIAHVADPPGSSGAIDFLTTYFSNSVRMLHAASGDPSLPVALSGYPTPVVPLPGAHPVLRTALCGGNGALQDMRVVQSVMKTDVTIETGRFDMVQVFRVPRLVRVQWAEVAVMRVPDVYEIGSMGIYDASPGDPPLAIRHPLASATFRPNVPGASWASHYDFDTSIVLVPNHDYWLYVASVHCYPLGAHAITGSEGADFTSGIGAFWSRRASGDVWTAETGRALAFKLIGDTTSVTGVEPSSARGTLKLEASPNPARGSAVFTWSGAVGAVRLEVLDARGRRVASSVKQSGAAGQWTWSVASTARPLPAGLYFARVTDSEGHAAVARVAVIR